MMVAVTVSLVPLLGVRVTRVSEVLVNKHHAAPGGQDSRNLDDATGNAAPVVHRVD